MHHTLGNAGNIPAAGDLAPDIALPLEHANAQLSDFRGVPVVLAFHAPHWDPARADEIDGYRRLTAGAENADGATTPVLIHNNTDAAARFGVRDCSAVFVIDETGRVQWRHVVGRDTLGAPPTNVRGDEPPEACGYESPAAIHGGWTRRQFVATTLGAALALALEPVFSRAARAESSVVATTAPDVPLRPVTLRVNGKDITLSLEPRVTLLDALREYAGLTGSKKGCDHGQCGACTVHIEGRRVLSCLTFAVMEQGKSITTIEGLATGETLHPMQRAFIEHDGFQCGYCTSGQIMSAVSVLGEPWGSGDDDVREAMSGNICRCGAYPGIVAAVQGVRRNGAQQK
jgi:xanthine dehydrogenase YagT iron-sulfur-binding subunit